MGHQDKVGEAAFFLEIGNGYHEITAHQVQAAEMLCNIETLMAQSDWSEEARQSRAIRVYLRTPDDYPSVAAVSLLAGEVHPVLRPLMA